MTRSRPSSTARGAPLRVLAATAAFALVHSALASRRAKALARTALGERASDGWYRAAYNVHAVVSFTALAWWARRLPDRTLWEAHGPWRALLHAAQLGGLALGTLAARDVGYARIAGVASVRAWLRGDARVPPAPEAQGPAPDDDGEFRARGPFRASRHPLNVAPLPVLWCMPRMTVNLATFNAAATLYLVLGSRHEEARLRAAHGDAYERYRRSGIPFYLPRPVRTTHATLPTPA
ncbi:MAG: hypothetical protein MUF21_13675 [Gemmatimonadaceae bacterium]|nr:hypothetical protein [Gemmatimonadaceae bacterium]